MKESWLTVPDYPGYKVSDLGRVLSKTGRILKPRLLKSNYYIVDLSKDGKAKSFYIHKLVADLHVEKRVEDVPEDVLLDEKYNIYMVTNQVIDPIDITDDLRVNDIPKYKDIHPDPREVLTHVIHKNLIKTDNRSLNLKWVTQSEARAYAYAHESYEYNSIKDSLDKGDIEFHRHNIFKKGQIKKLWFKYKDKYYKVYDTGTALVIILREKGDKSLQYLSIARILMDEPPSDDHVIGYRDFDYTNVSKRNLIWETRKEKSERYAKSNPLHTFQLKKRGININPPSFVMTDKRKNNIITMKENGKSLRTISKLIGIPLTTLHTYLKEWESQNQI